MLQPIWDSKGKQIEKAVFLKMNFLANENTLIKCILHLKYNPVFKFF